ncbi:MAG: PDGLE domain-containing protein [Candidatus Goldiibacteriota bacterium]|jgi:hypothetical protein
MKPVTKLWLGLAVIAALTPLGLFIPALFKAGGAWGEWGPEEIKKLTGFVPEKLGQLSGLWKAPMADYSFSGWENKGLAHLSFAYVCSAILGALLIAAIALAVGRILAEGKKK